MRIITKGCMKNEFGYCNSNSGTAGTFFDCQRDRCIRCAKPISCRHYILGYSSVMEIIWIFLGAPDLAITEAAVGAGISSVLFFLTLKQIHALKGTREG